MNKSLKKGLVIVSSAIAFIGLVAVAPFSRIVYGIYDTIRTNEIIKQLEAEKEKGEIEVNDFHKQAFFMQKTEAKDGATINRYELLVLTSDSTYELSSYEQVVTEKSSYTSEYFHMSGDYDRTENEITIKPGIGVYSINANNAGFVHYNAQYQTAEEAGGEKLRDEIYDMKYSSRKIALNADGTFAVGGKSDSQEFVEAPVGRSVYATKTTQGRITMKTLVVFEDGTYIVYSQATNSSNAEQTTGAFFGLSTYVINEGDSDIVPIETNPDETYDIITGKNGQGFMYANNNGSHMQFDLQAESQFAQWLATSFNASSPTFYVSESGFSIKTGALTTKVEKWGLYVPAATVEEEKPQETKDIKLEIASSVEDKPFVLELKEDGTLTTGWTNYPAQTMKDAKWYAFNGVLVFDMGETGYTAAIDGNQISVNYGQMGEKVYTLTDAQLATLLENEQPMQLEVETNVEGKPFVLELRADGTLTTGWTNYPAQTMKDASWSMNGDTLVFDMGETGYTVVVEENTITINYGQMGEKVYTISDVQLSALKSVSKDVTLEVETNVEGKPFVLELRADGTLTTGWTNYPAQTMKDAKWYAFNGVLVLDMGETGYTAVIDGNQISINYGQMGEKVYTLTDAQLATLLENEQPMQLEVETNVEGKPFVLIFNADGTLTTGWTNYPAQTMKDASWSMNGDTLVFDMGETGYTAVVEDNTITINYGQMGEKVYTISDVQLSALKGSAKDVTLEVETNVEGKPFVLELRADGTLTTGWTNYPAQTMKDANWTVFNGVLVFDMGETGYTAIMNGNEISINYGQMGTKVYTISDEMIASLSQNASPITLEVASSTEGKPFVLTFNEDGTLTTGWTNYPAQTMKNATWSIFNGKLSFDMGETGYTITVEENTITVNYGQMGAKAYTITDGQLSALNSLSSSITLEVPSSAEGKPFVLTINGDGTLTTGWTNYPAQTMKDAKWSVEEGALVFDMGETGYTVSVDGNSITVNFGQMGSKEFTMTEEQKALLLG